MFKPLQDTDPMPFGVHKGKQMDQVPASYLDWLHDQSWINDWPRVKRYIENNRRHIDQELLDEEERRCTED